MLEKLKIDIEKTLIHDNVGECKQKIRTLAKEARAKISVAEKEHMEKIMVSRAHAQAVVKRLTLRLLLSSSATE